MFPFENFDCVQTVQGDIKISFYLIFSYLTVLFFIPFYARMGNEFETMVVFKK